MICTACTGIHGLYKAALFFFFHTKHSKQWVITLFVSVDNATVTIPIRFDLLFLDDWRSLKRDLDDSQDITA